jgi:hypothetical protein
MVAKPYSEVVELEEVKNIVKDYSELEKFLSRNEDNWVKRAFENGNEQLIGIFYNNRSRENRLEMMNNAFKSLDKDEEGSAEIREKIFDDQSFYDAFAEVQMISKLRELYGKEKVDINPTFGQENPSNPDILLETDQKNIVIEVTRTSGFSIEDDEESVEVGNAEAGFVPLSEGNKYGSVVKNKTGQLEPLQNRKEQVMLAIKSPNLSLDQPIFDSYIRGQPTIQVITEDKEPFATRTLPDVPVVNREDKSEIFDFFLLYDDFGQKQLYASQEVSESQIRSLEEKLSLEGTRRFVNDVNMDKEEYRDTKYN